MKTAGLFTLFLLALAGCGEDDVPAYPAMQYYGLVVHAEQQTPLDSIEFFFLSTDGMLEEGATIELTTGNVTDANGRFGFEVRLLGVDPYVCDWRGSVDASFRLVDHLDRVPPHQLEVPFCRDGLLAGKIIDLHIEM